MAFGISATAWLAGAAVVGTAATIYNGNKAVNAQEQSGRDANATTLTAQREAQAFQQKQADQSRADQEPWRLAGGNALAQLVQRTGSGGDLVHDFGATDFQADPGYAFRQTEGMKGLTNSAAARGGLLSGAALKAASAYNQNLASAEYGNAYSRFKGNQEGQYNKLASLAGVGQIAANNNGSNAMQLGSNVGNAMMTAGGNIAQNQMGMGNARASGYLAQGNALAGGLNQGVSLWNQYNANKPATIGATGGAPAGTYFDGYGYVPNGSN